MPQNNWNMGQWSAGDFNFGGGVPGMPSTAMAPPPAAFTPNAMPAGGGNTTGGGSVAGQVAQTAGDVVPDVNNPAGAGAGGFMKGLFGDQSPLEGIGSVAQGLASFGQIYASLKGLKLARDQFDFSKEAYQTNLGNTRKSYNTNLEDRIRSRTHFEGGSSGDVDKYLQKHSM